MILVKKKKRVEIVVKNFTKLLGTFIHLVKHFSE